MKRNAWDRIRQGLWHALERGFVDRVAPIEDDFRGPVLTPYDGSQDIELLEEAIAERYVVESTLGVGGMATVFSARDQRHERQVAIKVLKQDISEALGAERFLREIKIAAALRHPHILPLYDSGTSGDFIFYVMPVENSSLRDRLEDDRTVPIEEALRLTQEACSALDYAHGQGIVHRDIKPENILLSQGHAVIADFGIARAISAAGGNSLTQAGWPIGSPAYMSPEQVEAEVEADGRSDLYSLALVLYEMLSGRRVFTAPNLQALMARRVQTPLPDLSFSATVPQSVRDAILAALAPDRENRPATGAALMRLLAFDGRPGTNGYHTTPRPSSQPKVRSIAVLPFANLSGDTKDEYLSDGLTEELINALARFGELRVAARTSSFALKGAKVDITTAAKTLGVDTVLEGSVRRADGILRITAQLINGADGCHIWSERYDCDTGNVFAIQDEITQAIVDRLKLSLAASRDALARPPTTDIEAYHLYLKGRHHWNKRSKESLEQAVKYFTDAIERDPQFALAYSGIADAYILCGSYNFKPMSRAMTKVEAAVEQALALDEHLAEAHTSRGLVLRWKRDWHSEEAAYRRAIELNPSYPTAHQWFATHLAARGRFSEALDEIRLAEELDPLSHAISVTAAVVLFIARDYDGVTEQLNRTLELEPNFASVHAWLGNVYAQVGKHAEVGPAIARAHELAPDNRNVFIGLAYSHAVRGQRDQAMEILDKVEERGSVAWATMIHAALGDLDAALACLHQSAGSPDSWDSLYYIKVFPWLDPLRQDPRFQEILDRMEIPD